MPDNIANIVIPENEWIDLYAAAGVTVGTAIAVENIGSNDVYLAVSATQPAKDHTAYNVIRRDAEVLRNNAGDPGAWAFCRAGGKVSVSTPSQEGFTPVSNVRLSDGYGNPIGSYFGANNSYSLDVHMPDVHDKFVDEFFHQHTAITTTLIADIPAGGNQNFMDVADSTGFAVNDPIHLNTSSIETTHPVILVITPLGGTTARFTLDRRIDLFHATGDTVTKAILNMATIAGSLVAPQEYTLGPEPGSTAVWDIHALSFKMVHTSLGDMGTFGDIINGLTNGVFVRVRNDGVYRTLSNWKTNGDIRLDMYDEIYFADKSSGQGNASTSGTISLGSWGAVAKLRGATNDQIEIYVQDDLTPGTTSMELFSMKAQGHIESL